MFTNQVKFSTVKQVQTFVNVISKICVEFDLVHNKFVIDAKSIMGIFSLDLSNKLLLVIHTDDETINRYVVSELKEIGVFCEPK